MNSSTIKIDFFKMNCTQTQFDKDGFDAIVQSICNSYSDKIIFSISTTGFSNEPGNLTDSTTTLLQPVISVLQKYGIIIEAPASIQINKNEWNLPYVTLDSQLIKQNALPQVKPILVSASNDSDITLNMALITNSGTESIQPLGIGVDLLFFDRPDYAFTDCPEHILKQLFSKNELNLVNMQPAEINADRLFLAMVALKEAAFKAVYEACFLNSNQILENREIEKASFLDVEITTFNKTCTIIKLNNQLSELADLAGIVELRSGLYKGKNYFTSFALAAGNVKQDLNTKNYSGE